MNVPLASPLRGMVKSPLNAWLCVLAPPEPPVVGTQPTWTTIGASDINPYFNATIVLTATVHMVDADTPIPTGSVSFYAVPPSWSGGATVLLGTVSLATGGTTATWSVAREFGDWGFYARYNGDAKWAASQSAPVGVFWFGNLQLTFATGLPLTYFGGGGYMGGTWGTLVMGNIGFFDMPYGPDWNFSAYAWRSVYDPVDVSASVACASTGPTVWQLYISEENGNYTKARDAYYTLTGNSPIGTYTKTSETGVGGLSPMPDSFDVSAG